MPELSGRESEFLFLFLCACIAGGLRGFARFALNRVLVSVQAKLLDYRRTPDSSPEMAGVKQL